MESVRPAGSVFSPLDEELALLAGSVTPRLHEQMVRLGSWIPSFRQAAAVLEDFTGVFVSEASGRRYTEKAGAAYVAIEEATVTQIERELPPAPVGVKKLQMSVDGVMVPLVGGEWAEVKNMVIGEIGEPVEERGEQVVHLTNLSYFSRLSTSEQFQRQTLAETHRRGVESAQMVAAVNDGAEWIQGFVDYHRPDAVRILDFPHSAGYVSQIGQAALGAEESRTWLADQLHTLKHEGIEPVFVELEAQVAQHPDQIDALRYLEKRKKQMAYPTFQAAGLPIASGSVESGNKLVVEARMKGSGMHWARVHVDPMLALRNVVCNDRWEEAWPAIVHELRRQARRPKPTPTARPVDSLPALTLTLQPIPPKEAQPAVPSIPAPPKDLPTPGPRRPAASHPWRHSFIGNDRRL